MLSSLLNAQSHSIISAFSISYLSQPQIFSDDQLFVQLVVSFSITLQSFVNQPSSSMSGVVSMETILNHIHSKA